MPAGDGKLQLNFYGIAAVFKLLWYRGNAQRTTQQCQDKV